MVASADKCLTLDQAMMPMPTDDNEPEEDVPAWNKVIKDTLTIVADAEYDWYLQNIPTS